MGMMGCLGTTKVVRNASLPKDNTLNPLILENYIHRVYVGLLGRKPQVKEVVEAKRMLGNLNESKRRAWIMRVKRDSAYFSTLATKMRGEYLEGVNRRELEIMRIDLTKLLENEKQAIYFDQWQYQITQLQKLEGLSELLHEQQISWTDMHKLCVDNPYYDKLNMGIDNFILSCFQHFLYRYPSDYELSSARNMMYGRPAILFLKRGRNKRDFMKIFFESDAYLEGQIRALYKRDLMREPLASEMASCFRLFHNTGKLTDIQLNILASDEYLGK